jgi:hypothetical protein
MTHDVDWRRVARELTSPVAVVLNDLELLKEDIASCAAKLGKARDAIVDSMGEPIARRVLGPTLDALDPPRRKGSRTG